jgi:hypothetical protein
VETALRIQCKMGKTAFAILQIKCTTLTQIYVNAKVHSSHFRTIHVLAVLKILLKMGTNAFVIKRISNSISQALCAKKIKIMIRILQSIKIKTKL